MIAGHADSTGGEAYNDNLSERRAYSVRDALIAEGVDSERLIVSAFGERQPVASNATALGRQKNRVRAGLLDIVVESRLCRIGGRLGSWHASAGGVTGEIPPCLY